MAEPLPKPLRADVAVVGAGAAGLYAALPSASEGAHQGSDFPASDPALDGMHTLVPPGERPRLERWE